MRESAKKSKKSVWSLAKFAEMTKGGSLPADNFPALTFLLRFAIRHHSSAILFL
jgi:hypothetical protein